MSQKRFVKVQGGRLVMRLKRSMNWLIFRPFVYSVNSFKGFFFKKVPYNKMKKKIAQEDGEFSIISNLIAKDGINDNNKGLEL